MAAPSASSTEAAGRAKRSQLLGRLAFERVEEALLGWANYSEPSVLVTVGSTIEAAIQDSELHFAL